MNRLRRRIAPLVLLAALTACQSGPQMYLPQASALSSGRIKVGMDRAKVIELLGTPQKTEKYGTTEFFFYSAPWQMALPVAMYNPVAITDGKVAGMGQSYYQNASKRADKP